MRLDKVKEALETHKAELKDQGVKSLSVFGSVARGEAGPGSDVDLLIEVERPFGLFKLAEVKSYLEEILGCPVDLVTPDSLHPALRDTILNEAVRAA
jgi:predicted nucleotidyltransferase